MLLVVGDVRLDGLLLLYEYSTAFDATDCVGRDGTQLCRAECELLECSDCSGGSVHKIRCKMQASPASKHSEASNSPSSDACREQEPRACFTVYNLVSYRTLAWNSSKQAVDASKYREPSPERLIKDDEQA